jgi:hypothetical protein
MKHTCGSESIPQKRVQKIVNSLHSSNFFNFYSCTFLMVDMYFCQRQTGQSVGEIDLFVDTHTSKKTNTFVDEESRTAAVILKKIVEFTLYT